MTRYDASKPPLVPPSKPPLVPPFSQKKGESAYKSRWLVLFFARSSAVLPSEVSCDTDYDQH